LSYGCKKEGENKQGRAAKCKREVTPVRRDAISVFTRRMMALMALGRNGIL